MMEIYGEPSHGKSTIALDLMIAIQKAGGISAYIDSEMTFHEARAIRAGFVKDQNLLIESDTVEHGFSWIKHLLTKFAEKAIKDVPKIIVWDTIAAAQTEGEKEQDQFKAGMMDKPRKIRAGVRMVVPLLKPANTCLVIVNQTMVQIGAYQAKLITPGVGIHFMSSVRMIIKKSGHLEISGNKVGIRTRVLTEKNKLVSPNREVEIPIRFDIGVDHDYELLNYLLENGKKHIWNSGGWFYLQMKEDDNKDEDGLIKFRYADFSDLLQENPAIRPWLVETTKKILGG
jgi:RecA/RadA recombinase